MSQQTTPEERQLLQQKTNLVSSLLAVTGPVVPTPEQLEQYNQVVPGPSETVPAMYEIQQKADIQKEKAGQILRFLLGLAIVIGYICLVLFGEEKAYVTGVTGLIVGGVLFLVVFLSRLFHRGNKRRRRFTFAQKLRKQIL